MKSPGSCVLAINGGSSSIKFAAFEAGHLLRRIFVGSLDRIGHPQSSFRVDGSDRQDSFSRTPALPDHAAAANVLFDWIEHELCGVAVVAAGHRIVHGGPNYSAPQSVTNEMIESVRKLSLFDPEHLPEELQLIEMFGRRFPTIPQIACFDTAFHHDLPRVAQILAIPRRYEARGVRRYGFHGLSYAYLVSELVRVGDAAATSGRVILAHLGNGASLAAVRDGASIDTSMGFTPTAGVPMGTRSGDLDPGLAAYLARTEDMSAIEFSKMAHSLSGLLGVSESSSDMRDLLEREADDIRAREAVMLFCYQVRKWIGAFAAALGGLDTLVFSGGIGENASVIRERICAGLDFLGIAVDRERNAEHCALISPDDGPVRVRVIATNEELTIARAVADALDLF